jgi:tRNA dimethylallyltransferase
MKHDFIVITGGTATGKTAAAVAVAEGLNGEIISADSMQIYKFMDIGTAKPSKDEMRGIPHHLIDELTPDDVFSVARFTQMAGERINQIKERGKLPIIVGGTGFYVSAIINDTVFDTVETDEELRRELYKYASERGNAALHDRLREIDPESACAIHPNNVKRVIRAIEFERSAGFKISEHNERERAKKQNAKAPVFLLETEREVLYERINLRVDKMIERGLADEVKGLLEMGYSADLPSMQGLGYKETARYLRGDADFAQAVCDIKRNTRRFAKRQGTWFRNKLTAERIIVTDTDGKGTADEILRRIGVATDI